MNIRWKELALILSVVVLCMTMTTACSLAGKRSTDNGWQVSLVNGRDFDDGDGKYILAIYDGNLSEESISVLQLWSGRKEKAD